MNNNPFPQKTLGVFALIMINVVAVDSLRSLPFSAVYGTSLVIYYLIASVVFLIPTALVAAELATAWPDRGGIYVWVREAFGPLWGFVTIWLQWIYNIVWYPTILSFIAGAISYLINPALAQDKLYMLVVIMVVFWGCTLLNCFGMRLSSLISTVGALIGTLVPMLFIIILGIIWISEGNPIQISFAAKEFLPDITNISSLTFLLAVLFGLVGMEMSAVHADEVRNPGKAFPRAILTSSLMIFVSLVFASLAIAIVVPQHDLSVITGLIDAFAIFFNAYHMHWMIPVITILIIIGGISGVATWIIGPTKGLMVAVHDGSAPPIFGTMTEKNVPVIVLLVQAGIFTILCSVFLFMPTVSSSYWILTAMTAQLAMLVYIMMFASAIWLRYKRPDVARAYKISGKRLGIWIVGSVGILSSLGVIALGFIPPSQIQTGGLLKYELILIIGIVLLCTPPFIIYALRKPHWGK